MSSALNTFFDQQRDVCVAFLFGSRARGESEPSDWDIAVHFNQDLPRLDELARLERLRSALTIAIPCPADHLDLVDLRRAPLNLCITVAEEGEILKGRQSLELFRFYQRAWSRQEEFHFRKAHGL